MSEEPYPYATLEKEGYELEAVEVANWENHGVINEPIPSDEQRYAVGEGDVVKLIFHYREPLKVKGKSYHAEHMWAVVTSTDQGFITGFLDNEPFYTKILQPGDELTFHPEHIISIWRGE